jgi:hypothetical protein
MDEGRPAAGASVVPGARVTIAEHAIRIGESAPEGHGEPKINLVREGGVVRAIEVTCSCGQVIRIRCDYG